MEHPLRITYKDNDYNFKLIKEGAVSKKTRQFQIRINEDVVTIVKTPKGWEKQEDGIQTDPGLITAIGHSLSLRFRLE